MNNEKNYEVLLTGNNGTPVKSWTKGVPFEHEAKEQLNKLAEMPFVFKHIAVMPDVHAGIGSTVGSVIATKAAIIPAAVSVDIGCVDKDTEFLTPDGWKTISNFNDDFVMQYDPSTGFAEFVKPTFFIKLPCSSFYYIHTKYGVDQMLSHEHKVLYAKYDRSYEFNKLDTISAEELANQHAKLKNGFRGRFLTTFKLHESPTDFLVSQSEEKLRIMVMVMADGHFPNENTNNCILTFKKERKIKRAKQLLESANIPYSLYVHNSVSTIRFTAPFHEKNMKWLWKASPKELRIICDEVFHWDGNLKDRCFFTRVKESADFISYAFTACGYRAVMRMDLKEGVPDYRVFANSNIKVGINGTPKTVIQTVKSEDGFKYCFTVPSGFWVMRRNGVVAMTGNCGMLAAKTNLQAKDLPDSLLTLRNLIESAVPHGRTDNGGKNDRGAWGDVPNNVQLIWKNDLYPRFDKIIKKHQKAQAFNSMNHLGTLGTGNHFIEVCLDENQNVWVMLHSGSRGLGNRIGSYFIDLAKKEMERWFINLPNKDLAYLPEGTQYYHDYVEAVHFAQDYAKMNRAIMFESVMEAMKKIFPHVSIVETAINCHHNYVEVENHFGENVFVTRKGAVRARTTDLGIIPGSMGAKSYIVRGKGNPDSFCSCSHGAGRKMSRTEAKKKFTIQDHIEATKGVECRKDADVIDETPAAYKDIDSVMEAQKDLVEVIHTLKQVLCVKG